VLTSKVCVQDDEAKNIKLIIVINIVCTLIEAFEAKRKILV